MSAAIATPAAAARDEAAPARLNRTCQACRERKIKCVPVPSGGAEKRCTRCQKLAIECAFAPAMRKKTRRRNEGRIKDLERRLAAIQAAVAAGPGDSAAALAKGFFAESAASSPAGGELRPLSTAQFASAQTLLEAETPSSGSSDVGAGDVFADGFLNANLVDRLFSAFRIQLAPLYPIVFLSPASTWQSVRQERPALFRAILTAASSTVYPHLSNKLFRETGQYLAEKVMVVGDKSLDLVQALLVLSTWHLPPSTFVELKFSQYAQMAATMVVDFRASNDARYAIPSYDAALEISEELVEVCRTFAANYFLCSSMAMSFRRPTSLPYGHWVESCVKILECSPNKQAQDCRLAAWVRLQRIAEESLSAVGLDGAMPVDFSDARTKFILKGCVEKVAQWRAALPTGVLNETLEIHYRMILISLHEPTLYDGHNLGDFRPPYTLRRLPLNKPAPTEPSRLGTSSLGDCIAAAQDLVEIFLNLSTDVFLAMPVVTYTRLAYAVIVMIKCNVSTRSSSFSYDPSTDPTRALAALLYKLESVQNQSQGSFPVPAVFHSILSAISTWFADTYTQGSDSDGEGVIEPLLRLSIENPTAYAEDTSQYGMMGGYLCGPEDRLPTPSSSGWRESVSLDDTWFDTSGLESLLQFPEFLDPGTEIQDRETLFT